MWFRKYLSHNFQKAEEVLEDMMVLSLLYTFPSVGYHQRRMMSPIDLQCDSNSGIVCKFLVQIQGGGAQSPVVIRPGFWQHYPSWHLERSQQ